MSELIMYVYIKLLQYNYIRMYLHLRIYLVHHHTVLHIIMLTWCCLSGVPYTPYDDNDVTEKHTTMCSMYITIGLCNISEDELQINNIVIYISADVI